MVILLTTRFNTEKARQRTNNVTLRRVGPTTVAVETVESTTHSECLFVALGIQHATCIRHIVICGLTGSTKLLHVISQTAQFSKNVTENKLCLGCLYDFRLRRFSFLEETSEI